MESIVSNMEKERTVYCEEGIQDEVDKDGMSSWEAGFMSGYNGGD